MKEIIFKNKIRLILLFILFSIILFFAFDKIPRSVKGQDILSYTLNGKTYRLMVANTEAEREKGLMFYRKLDNVDGMIFLFNDRQYRSFWNKNTFMNLDLYWLDEDQVVGKSYLPSIEISKDIVNVNSPSEVNKVIELPHGK